MKKLLKAHYSEIQILEKNEIWFFCLKY